MKKVFYVGLLAYLVFLTGCGTLLPKKVEFLQDKVKKYPVATQSQKEVQRQVAQRAQEKTIETLTAAASEQASPAVMEPAKEAVILTSAVAESVGPPISRPSIDTQALSDELRKSVAKLNKKVDSFVEDNNENAGKKIEGTGLVQIPYFAWIGALALIVLVGWNLAKAALTAASAANPAALVGVGAMNVASTTAGKGVVQLVNGGQKFLQWVAAEVSDPALRQKIVDGFLTMHKKSQDEDVKAVVDRLVK